jgi:hypothetical protein
MKEWQRSDPKRVNKGMYEGTKKLAPRVREEVIAKFKANGVPDGPHLHSIEARVYKNGMGYIHAKDERKIKTWLERGTRGGKKTARKGARAWAAGKSLVRKENKAGYYEAEIEKALK